MENLEIFNKNPFHIKNKIQKYVELKNSLEVWMLNVDDSVNNTDNYITWDLMVYLGLFTITFFSMSPFIIVLLSIGVFKSFLSGILWGATASAVNTFYMRNLKFGYFKNRNTKLIKLKEEIKDFLEESSNIYAVINENEKIIKGLLNKVEKEELKEFLKEKTNDILEKIKNKK